MLFLCLSQFVEMLKTGVGSHIITVCIDLRRLWGAAQRSSTGGLATNVVARVSCAVRPGPPPGAVLPVTANTFTAITEYQTTSPLPESKGWNVILTGKALFTWIRLGLLISWPELRWWGWVVPSRGSPPPPTASPSPSCPSGSSQCRPQNLARPSSSHDSSQDFNGEMQEFVSTNSPLPVVVITTARLSSAVGYY